MTTIIADAKARIMACDSRMTGHLIGHTKKVWRIQGSLFGVSGRLASCTAFVNYLKLGDRTEGVEAPCMEHVRALVLTDGGIYMYDGGPTPFKVDDRIWAVGSGSAAAMGAMAAGATPQEAIRIAAKYDEGTGGPVRTFAL